MPYRKADVKLLIPVLINTPVPGLATGAGEFPRFRSEMGKFLGVSTALDGSSVSGGFGKNQLQPVPWAVWKQISGWDLAWRAF